MHYYNYQPYDSLFEKTQNNDQATVKFNRQRHPSNLGFSDENEFKPVRVDKIKSYLLDNIVEYNKNLTPDEINGTTVNNILKYDNLMTLREYDKMMIAKEYQKLYGLTRDANIIQQEKFENSKFSNLSLTEIAENFTRVMMELINEIPKAYEKDELNYQMFTREDRIIYVGIFFILLAVFLYFIFVSR